MRECAIGEQNWRLSVLAGGISVERVEYWDEISLSSQPEFIRGGSGGIAPDDVHLTSRESLAKQVGAWAKIQHYPT